MPFSSAAQRRYLWAKHPDIAREFAAATPKDAKLPEHVKKAHVRGTIAALERFGLKQAAEELRLKLPNRTFHGFEAAHKSEARRGTKAGNDGTSDVLADALKQLETPVSPGNTEAARDPLDRATAWGAPSNLSAGDTASRMSDMGQNTSFGGV